MKQKSEIIHPGLYIKDKVLPKELSVKDAAKLLGVGRPALSNLLNAKSALSSEMAVRLEKTFHTSAKQLMQMQAEFDGMTAIRGSSEVAIQKYVPQLFKIKANQIENWATTSVKPRYLLAVLLRKLIHSTGRELTQVDFPGFENAERKGPDGKLDSNTQTPWIPHGKSLWEFGCTRVANTKAERDFNARVKSVPKEKRTDLTFVFVTPMNWPGKTQWQAEKEELKEWGSVKAFDASDLEQWIEQSSIAQVWLAEQLGFATSEVQTLESYWTKWSGITIPTLSPTLFSPAVVDYENIINDWLQKAPATPLIVAADSRGEGIAFLARVFLSEKIAQRYTDSPLIYKSANTIIKHFNAATAPQVLVISDEQVEKELGVVLKRHHVIIVRPKNSIIGKASITIDYLTGDAFRLALNEMGYHNDQADLIGRETAFSPTILRRKLSGLEAIKIPEWMRNDTAARNIIPIVLIGCWHSRSKGDRVILSAIGRKGYDDIERDVVELLRQEDSPMWLVDEYYGVVSKMDILFVISKIITKQDLDDFFQVAQIVLSETDPALDLQVDNRWAAVIYGKTREHSGALRKGICDSLVILAVHGNNLFQKRLKYDVEHRVNSLVRSLLTPLTIDKLLSQNKNLCSYAEAAPKEFISILEEDLQQESPTIMELMTPVKGDIFSRCERTDLLWSLETLAWKPEYIMKVCDILCQLANKKIDDNWVNKPDNSLLAIFRSWIPQTSATLEQRIQVLERIIKRFPAHGLKICISQIDRHGIGHYNHRPRWRTDAVGHGQPVTTSVRHQFDIKCLDLAIKFRPHSVETLTNLIKKSEFLSEDFQVRIWTEVEEWLQSTPSEKERAELRENLRLYAFTPRGKKRNLSDKIKQIASDILENLTPTDVVLKESWLFKSPWVHESAGELEDHKFDYRKREEMIDKLRTNAMSSIWLQCGELGVLQLHSMSAAPDVVGWYLAKIIEELKVKSFVRQCLGQVDDRTNIDEMLRGFLRKLPKDLRNETVLNLQEDLATQEIIRLLNCCPFTHETWQLLDRLSPEISNQYWIAVLPVSYAAALIEDHGDEMIDNLLRVNRPAAAFHAIHYAVEKVDTSRLKKILNSMGTISEVNPGGRYGFSAWDIGHTLQILGARPDITEEEMADLEFIYIKILDLHDYKIPNLQKRLAKSPELFAQVVALTYRRTDGGEDPPEWKTDDASVSRIFHATYKLLENIRILPGANETGEIDNAVMRTWLKETRELFKKYGRVASGDRAIGQLFAAAPIGKDGVWPCESVRDILEEISSKEIALGLLTGLYNSRGASFRPPGGDEERELSTKYSGWSGAISFTHPYLSNVLNNIADSLNRDAEWQDSKDDLHKVFNRLS